MKYFTVKKLDIVVIVIVILVSLLAFGYNNTRNSGDYVIITVDGAVVRQLDLSKDCAYDVVIDSEVTNTIEIQNKNVSVIYANCPDKICNKHKSISKSGESIICLPNKVVVSIKSNSDYEIDGVAR